MATLKKIETYEEMQKAKNWSSENANNSMERAAKVQEMLAHPELGEANN